MEIRVALWNLDFTRISCIITNLKKTRVGRLGQQLDRITSGSWSVDKARSMCRVIYLKCIARKSLMSAVNLRDVRWLSKLTNDVKKHQYPRNRLAIISVGKLSRFIQ